jgi:hypothetical protein
MKLTGVMSGRGRLWKMRTYAVRDADREEPVVTAEVRKAVPGQDESLPFGPRRVAQTVVRRVLDCHGDGVAKVDG